MQQLRQPLLMNRTSEYRRRACLDETHNPAEQVNEGKGAEMGKVISQASMSLDGFIADTNDQVGPLFDWYDNGNVQVTGADPDPVFVVTRQPPTDWPYPDAPFTFVTDGLHSALAQAQAAAGDRDVSITPGSLAGQAFEAGLIDEVRIDLVPVVFGAGVRYFGDYAGSPFLLDDPQIVQGDRVTHLHYRLRKSG